MDINGYQEWTKKFDLERDVRMLSLGLCGEAGEFADKVKKTHRIPPLIVSPEELAAELGDVLWYLCRLASTYGYTMTQIMAFNVTKLESRAARGVLHGEGDNR